MDASTAIVHQEKAASHTVPMSGVPFNPWLRLAHISSTSIGHAAHHAPLRVIKDFEIVLQFEGSAWIWSQQQNGSVNIEPGEVAFIAPDYVHAWGAQSGTHLGFISTCMRNPCWERWKIFVC
jgi:hypothetical protein